VAPNRLMNVIRLVIALVVGGAAGLLAVPLLPQQAQDWVSSRQQRTSELIDTDVSSVDPTPPNAPTSPVFQTSTPTKSPASTPISNQSPLSAPTLAPVLVPTPTIITMSLKATPVRPSASPTNTLAPIVPTSTPRPRTAGDILREYDEGRITVEEAAQRLEQLKPTMPPTPPPSPAPTRSPSPTPTPLNEWRSYLLGLINKDRADNGVPAVTLGTNPAAQTHAEEMLEYSYLSHWGLDGLKPYMRYAAAGGVDYSAENVSGVDSPPDPRVRYKEIEVKQELREAETGFMGSAGHRSNILDPLHKVVNLGIACNEITCAVVQLFTGNYVKFETLPTITSSFLSFSGSFSGGFQFEQADVWFDQLPHDLTLGQLDATSCYTTGQTPVAFLLSPPTPGSYYPQSFDTYTWSACKSPYSVDPQAPRTPPSSPGVFRIPIPSLLVGLVTTPWLVADQWDATPPRFSVLADLSEILVDKGPGVYTIIIWGTHGGDSVPLTDFPIFVRE